MQTVTGACLDTWHGNENQLSGSLAGAVKAFETATAEEDFDTAAIIIGEANGRVRDVHQYRGDQSDVRSRRLSH